MKCIFDIIINFVLILLFVIINLIKFKLVLNYIFEFNLRYFNL